MIWKTIFLAVVVGALAKPPEKTSSRNSENVIAHSKNVDFERCIKRSIDTEGVKKEFLDALRAESLVPVVKKYCRKSAEVKVCLRDYIAVALPWNMQIIQDSLGGVYNASNEAIDFICYNDSEKLASFIAGGGYQCLVEQSTDIDTCSKSIHSTMSIDDIFSAHQQQERNRICDDIRNCIKRALERCPTRAAVNMVDSLFDIARKTNTCAGLFLIGAA